MPAKLGRREADHFFHQIGETLGAIDRALRARGCSHCSEPLRRACQRADFSSQAVRRELALRQANRSAGIRQHKENLKLGRLGKDLHTRSGKDLPTGRPRRVFRRDQVAELRSKGQSWREIARELGVPVSTLRRAA